MPGPKPQPAAIKAQRASSRRPVGQAPKIDQVTGAAPRAPAFVTGEALGIWNAKAELLAGARLLTAADVNAFGRYCVNHAKWQLMHERLEDGELTYTVTTASGDVHRPRPEFMVAERLERMLLAAEDRFGLNPAERQRIMAARSQSGVSGDLFGPRENAGENDPATKATEATRPAEGPLGLLN